MKTAALLTHATRGAAFLVRPRRLSIPVTSSSRALSATTVKHTHTSTHTSTHATHIAHEDESSEGDDEHDKPFLGRLPAQGPSAEERQKYKSDSQTLARWLDVSVVKRKGRVFDADPREVQASSAMVFPSLAVSSLAGESVSLPQAVPAEAKLVVFSFKHYGFSLVRSWLDPWIAKYQPGNAAGVAAVEICFVEFGFLSMAKSLFATSIKNQISPQQHGSTFLAFGGILDFAASLQLPNVYTGYAFLLDKQNRIRWQGCGEAREDELQTLFRCAEILLNENKAAKKHK